jgi:hypothetical protein
MDAVLTPTEVTADTYKASYDPSAHTVQFIGALRLAGMEEYAPIMDLLAQAMAQQPEQITLDLQQLEFLNSSGINMLSKFVIKVRQNGQINLQVNGSQSIPWQGKSLKNLQRLMPNLKIELM